MTNIFIQNKTGDFIGHCWPGDSLWIDFLNENAQQFWVSWFSFEKFKGSTHIYDIWNDMNEPAVFDRKNLKMPLTAMHMKANG